MHYRQLERCKLWVLTKSGWNFDAHVTIDFKCIQELQWWLRTLPTTECPIQRGNPTIVMTTDASNKGWGAALLGICTGGRFSLKESVLSINSKETLAPYYGLRSFASRLSNHHILIKSDNTTATSYIKNQGGMQSPSRDKIAKDISGCQLKTFKSFIFLRKNLYLT